MNDQEFEAYMRQMDDDLLFNLYADNNKSSIQIGKTIIPADKETFNQMWLAKEFDNIEPSLRLKINRLSLLHTSLHFGRYQWDEYFFKKREDLLHTSARKLWKTSEYYIDISIKTNNILTLTSKRKIKNMSLEKLPSLNIFEDEYDDDSDLIQYYLSGPPEALMFPDIDDDTDKLSIVYSNPYLIEIFRTIVLRYQHLCNKSNEERISIYMSEILALYNKIKFIQELMYFGVKCVMHKFIEIKHNYLHIDPEIRDINEEPNKFQDISYKEALYKFYIFCTSRELTTPINICKAHFLGDVIIHYEDIKNIIKNNLLPLSSCIRQDKLRSVCCEIILTYLKPTCVTEQYITSKMVSII
jgi:hypothetical protein